MYKKRNKWPMIVAGAVGILILAAFFLLQGFLKKGPEPVPIVEEIMVEPEIQNYEVLIHKTNAGTIGFESRYMKKNDETTTVLSIPEKELVSMKVDPKAGKYLESVNIYDALNVNSAISNVITKLDGGTYNIDFTMPDTNIVMTFQFSDIPMEPEISTTPAATAVPSPTSEGFPYGLKLHGVTADVITAFNGEFDNRDFLQQLGDGLHMNSARSDYFRVEDVTFSTEAYNGTKESDKVYYYVYFNNDPAWKVLSTYDLKENTYVFTEIPVEATPTPAPAGETQNYGYGFGNQTTGSYPQTGTAVTPAPAATQLDILKVSNNFLSFTGGDDSKFYDEIFDYLVEQKGYEGYLQGNMVHYKIYPEKQTAGITIRMKNGITVTGIYDKNADKYSFSESSDEAA